MTADSDTEWADGWVALQRFVETRGSAQVPARAVAGGLALGAWVAGRREEYWAGTLHPYRVARLEALAGWTWAGAAQRRWENRLEALAQHAARHGTAVTEPDTVVGKISVGSWAHTQRVRHAAGTLPVQLATRLELLPGWEWTVVEDRWARGLRAANEYVNEHGTLDELDAATVVNGVSLAHWIRRCQEDYRAGALSTAQVDALLALPGWHPVGDDERWEQGMQALRRYYVEHGSAAPPQKAVIDGFALGMWVHNRRRQHRVGRLSDARVFELESVPGWRWSHRDTGV